MKKILGYCLLPFLMFSCISIPTTNSANSPEPITNSTNIYDPTFSIPEGAELLESTEFKDNGIPYVIEKRYRLSSGEILYAYYDIEGTNSVTIQKIESNPMLSMGTNVNIPGLPGYREFNFGDDRRKLVQFMKIFKLGQKEYRGGAKTPSLGDSIFTPSGVYRNEFLLLLDLYDETWVLEHRKWSGRDLATTNTTSLIHVNKYND